MTLHSGWLSPTGQTRQATRHTALGATTPAGPLQSRSGILPGTYDGQYRVGGLWMSGNAGTMTAVVFHGRAVIQGTTTQGAYPVALDEDITVTFADGDAQHGRIDLLVLRVYDDAYDGSGRTEAVVEIVQGTPAAAPVAPTTPDLALPLFRVSVPAGTSAGTGGIPWTTSTTDLRTTLVSAGGILPVYNNATAAGSYPGQYQDNDNSGFLQRWNGTEWVRYPKALGGIAPTGTVTTGSYTGQYRDSSLGVLQRWNGSAWQSAITPPPFASSLDSGYTTSTTYTAALTESTVTALTLAFTAPTTGAVLLHFGARMLTQSSTTATAFMAAQVTQGGTVVSSANDEYCVSHGGTVYSSASTVWRLGALTPGTSYTATAMHRSSDAAVTCWFDNIFMRVEPAN
ncbi:hypothetical protein OG252_21835 [Streptomyces sp. NBC_01352]|uniref:hypothetical protein n=1 Tax=unclassified Streptomyces TaxID=2593676 RepID=UPI002250A9EE|nr:MULTISPECIES: hypothetical protein [unclassified Streptomyces]MCX4698628.1 hypothetical protein [Streptomyces sp. NBC_01373]